MRCLLLLAVLVVAVRAATVTSSVSARSSSDGGDTTFSSHTFSDSEPSSVGLGLRSSFGRPSSAGTLGLRSSFLSSQGDSVPGGGLSRVQADLNRVANHLANVQSSLNG